MMFDFRHGIQPKYYQRLNEEADVKIQLASFKLDILRDL